ncbi:MAG: DUF523 domain-containing protein [Pseudomonadota bacterium]
MFLIAHRRLTHYSMVRPSSVTGAPTGNYGDIWIERTPVLEERASVPASFRFVTSKTGEDHTAGMVDRCSKKVKALEKEDLCGFIFKKGSPSSGMERVRVYGGNGPHVGNTSEILARELSGNCGEVPAQFMN